MEHILRSLPRSVRISYKCVVTGKFKSLIFPSGYNYNITAASTTERSKELSDREANGQHEEIFRTPCCADTDGASVFGYVNDNMTLKSASQIFESINI